MRSPFPARFPGSCLCGARFQAGAPIYWDSSARRATLCPACASPKARVGVPFTLRGGLVVRFDTHPTTGAVVICLVMDPCSLRDFEIYGLTDGKWGPRPGGRGLVLTQPATHEQIEGWRAQAEAATKAA